MHPRSDRQAGERLLDTGVRLWGLGLFEQAANVLSTVKKDQLFRKGVEMTDDEVADLKKPILDKYESEGSPYYSTARIWDDGVIDPIQTRLVLALGISASLNADIPEAPFSLYRM